ncbi:sigma-54 interaction domain-containing protein [Salisaeta longa]|uniref:sigma-54 interaction domain-containing protein n=1 Tax=Salisaeta longa TaxID=503170 RepID=UPI0003B6A388|nr:sigma-54 dependent transcriptional regulator [Salisaeta longa]
MDRASIQERFGIVGSSDAIKNVIDRARQVAQTDITVLLQGESGVGKELIAEVVHQLSTRRHEPMVIVNCGAIPEGLIESELFGAEKGAYTGAVQKREGYFEEADGGTIFLDEIGEMPMAAQVRLLRVLESGTFSRVGASQQITTDVRIVAATNKDLGEEVRRGNFRKDLYYRLSTVLIDIPPLRERREDIEPIFETFVHRFANEYNSPMKQLTDAARELLEGYHWPGNVRELRNVAEQCVVLLRGDTVSADDLRPLLRDVGAGASSRGLVRMDDDNQRRQNNEAHDFRERELLYRAILEMRMDLRDLKDQMGQLSSNIGVMVPRSVAEKSDFPARYDDFVIVPDAQNAPSSGSGTSGRRSDASADYDALVRDVVYEVEQDEPSAPAAPSDTGADAADEDDELPTLAEAELDLIRQALERFDGNRRKTAEALDISERTLYRKLKDIEDA